MRVGERCGHGPDGRWWTYGCQGHSHRRVQPHPGRSPRRRGRPVPDDLHARPAPDANSVAWLVWHLTRVQDDHVADASGLDQVWLSQGWEKRFGLDLPASDTGYGHSSGAGRQGAGRLRRPADRLLRRRARADPRSSCAALGRRGSGPRSWTSAGTRRHPRRTAGQCPGRRSPARRPGRLSYGDWFRARRA